MSKRLLLLFTFTLIAATVAIAQPADEKGFVFATGDGPVLREEPKADAASKASVPVGGRLVYRKVVRGTGGIEWYFVEMPGAGTGWLAAANASATRPNAPPPPRPIKAATLPSASPESSSASTASTRPLASRGASAKFAQSASAQTAGARGLEARTLSARGVASTEAANQIIQKAAIDYVSIERVVGIQMRDPPHPDGRYADVTATGRKADSEAFAKKVQEGD